jgi:hypothetical protein
LSSRPEPEQVMYAVRRSSPPKQMLVVSTSPVATKSTSSPSGEITVTPPLTSVATQTLPSPSTPSESSSWKPGRPYRHCHVSTRPSSSTSPGAVMRRRMTRPVQVSAQYSTRPSGDRPMPLGSCAGKTTSRMPEPSALA